MGASCSEILSPDITDHELEVNSPGDSTFTSNSSVTFWWEDDVDIEQYEFRVTYGPIGSQSLVVDTTLLTNSFTRSLTSDQAYSWQVRGKNEGSVTPWVYRTIFIDETEPDKATATAWDGDTMISGNSATLTWYSTDFPLGGVAYPVADSLLLYRRNDSTTVGGKWYIEAGEAKEFSLSSTAPSPMNGPGTYYWKIVSIDKAGNRRASDLFRFSVQ